MKKDEEDRVCLHQQWSHPMECEPHSEREAPLRDNVEKFLYQICEQCGITRRIDGK